MDDKVVPTIAKSELTTIIRRLEAATSRLEDIASSTVEQPKTNGASPAPASAPTTTSTPPAPPPVAKSIPEPLPDSIEDFDSFIRGTVRKYVNLSDELGGPVAEQVRTVP